MNTINSINNPLIRELKSLKVRKYRENKGLFFIEGLRFIEEALKADERIVRIFISDGLLKQKSWNSSFLLESIKRHDHETFLLPEKLFKEVSDTSSPQGILAVVRMKSVTIENIVRKDNLLVLLESIQDPGNMGTIIRTADAAGFTGVIVSKGCVDIYNPKVLRSTMGSIFHIPIAFSDRLTDTIANLKLKGVKVLAAHLKGTKNFFDVEFKNSLAIIIGNEAAGLSNEVAGCADSLIRIPMPGRAESLNASIAAALLMYECVRQQY